MTTKKRLDVAIVLFIISLIVLIVHNQQQPIISWADNTIHCFLLLSSLVTLGILLRVFRDILNGTDC